MTRPITAQPSDYACKGKLTGANVSDTPGQCAPAASYPNLDIKNLTLDDAKAIYQCDYWGKAGCSDMRPRLAFACFDAAANNGVSRTVRWLQAPVRVRQGGVYGPQKKAALDRAVARDPLDMELVQEVHARHIQFMAGLDGRKNYGLGWARRLALVPLQSGHRWPAEVA
jgi:lysozyme family protein